MAYLATTNAYTSGWIASILLTPLVLLAFTGLIRRVAWNIAPVLIFLTFWPLGIVYIIQKISNPKSELRNNLLYWIIPFSWAFLTEWFLVVFGILIILLAPINGWRIKKFCCGAGSRARSERLCDLVFSHYCECRTISSSLGEVWRLVSTDSPHYWWGLPRYWPANAGCPPIQPNLHTDIAVSRAHTTSLPCSSTLPRTWFMMWMNKLIVPCINMFDKEK